MAEVDRRCHRTAGAQLQLGNHCEQRTSMFVMKLSKCLDAAMLVIIRGSGAYPLLGLGMVVMEMGMVVWPVRVEVSPRW